MCLKAFSSLHSLMLNVIFTYLSKCLKMIFTYQSFSINRGRYEFLISPFHHCNHLLLYASYTWLKSVALPKNYWERS